MTERDGSSFRNPVPMVSMLVAVVLAGVLPFIGNRRFYLADDNIVSWMPTGRRIGELLGSGDSHLMDPDMWWAGNFVGSARYGVWNPLVLLLDATVLQLDDFALAMVIVTVVYLLLLSTGTYLLARDYGATPWPSALAGLVISTGGWTLWMDATWWTPHLASLALTPYVWLAARRLVRGAWSPVWLLLSGWLLVSVGNPYSNLVVFVVIVAVGVEAFDRQHLTPVITLVASLVSIALVALFVYLPFRITAPVGWREAGISNNEWWSPGFGDLLLMSSPTSNPFVPHFGRSVLEFPAVYLSWFVLPLAPWLAWRTLRRRSLAGLAVVAGVFLLLALGPSEFWLFRWPFRLVPYLHLPLVLGAAVLLSGDLHRDHRVRRCAASVGIVFVGAYLSWADVPADLNWHLAGAVVVLAGTGAAVIASVKRPGAIGSVLMAGTLIVLAFQLEWRPLNGSVSDYDLPRTGTFYEETFAERYPGTVIQIASHGAIPPADRTATAALGDITIGSTSIAAGLDSVNTFSGLGYNSFSNALCLRFDGAMCAEAWGRLFAPLDDSGRTLASLLGADTVVVQRTLIDTVTESIPAGWDIAEVTDHVVVWSRGLPDRWPGGRLTDVAGPIQVDQVTTIDSHRETVAFTRREPGEATLTFGRLAWPGYVATIDGRSLPLGEGPAGLVSVTIPPDVDSGTVDLSWSVPFWRRVQAVLLLGVLVGIGTEVWWRWSRRRRADDRT